MAGSLTPVSYTHLKYRHRTKGRHLSIKDRVSIHERSKEVDGKRFGDFEMDLIVDPDPVSYTHLVLEQICWQRSPFFFLSVEPGGGNGCGQEQGRHRDDGLPEVA